MKKYFNALLISMLLTSTVFGAQVTKQIEVLFNTINIVVNGEKVVADNMVHEGTTYVPLRAISELLNKDIIWEGETKTAYINDDSIGKEYPVAIITMESGDEIQIELYPETAPITVKNFISLMSQGFYDGLNFHRVVPGFVIQGGDPNGDGTGGSEKNIKGEFLKNGVKNDILHTKGTLSMARSDHPDSASSQFFIVLEDTHYLNGEYTAFGRVIQGMDMLDQIANVETDENDKPIIPQVIKSIKVKE